MAESDVALLRRSDHSLLVLINGKLDALDGRFEAMETRVDKLEQWRELHVREGDRRDWEIDRMTPDVEAAHDLKIRLDTLSSMLKFLVGGSVVTALLSLAALLLTIAHYSGGKFP